MNDCVSNKIDSNITGLRFAEECCLRDFCYVPAVKATGLLTFSGTGTDEDEVVIGSVTYTLVDALTGANDVLIGGSAAATAANLVAAINGAAGAGTTYGTGTVAHPDVSAELSGAAVAVTARVGGVAGNSIATTETGTGTSWAAATLGGGVAADGTAPTWYVLEPNSYNDFGGQLTLVSRNPINPSRQRKKGVITDLEASGGFGQDFTQTNYTRLLQGVCFADMREKATNIPMNGDAIPFSGVAGSTYTLGSGTVGSGFVGGDLVKGSGFAQAGNNGLKLVSSSTATTIVVSGALVSEASPPADAKVQKVGVQLASATANVDVSGSYPRLVRASGAFDFTTLGLTPGEWLFIGGDLTTERFTNAVNNGLVRVRQVGAAFIEFDKTNGTMVTETGTGKTIRLFLGNVIRNEKDPTLIKRRTYQLERTLGQDTNGTMSEYLVGAVANEFTLNVAQADKVTADITFIAVDNEQRTGLEGLKDGARPDLVESPAFNTSSDFSRIKLHAITAGNTNPAPLFAFLTELSLTVNNNVSANKAVGHLGAIDVSMGTFQVSGNITAYFSSIEAVQAVRNNEDVALDFALVKNNAGFVFDVPLIALGDGRLNVEQDQPITLPLTTDAAEGEHGYTLLINEFPYLPNLADV